MLGVVLQRNFEFVDKAVDVRSKGGMWLRCCDGTQGTYYFNPVVDFAENEAFNKLGAAL